VDVEPVGRLEVERIKGPKVWHWEKSGVAVDGTVERGKRHAIEQLGDIGVVDMFSYSKAPQFGLQEVALNQRR